MFPCAPLCSTETIEEFLKTLLFQQPSWLNLPWLLSLCCLVTASMFISPRSRFTEFLEAFPNPRPNFKENKRLHRQRMVTGWRVVSLCVSECRHRDKVGAAGYRGICTRGRESCFVHLCVSLRFTTPYITDFTVVILDAVCIATAAELLTPDANSGMWRTGRLQQQEVKRDKKKKRKTKSTTSSIDLGVLRLLDALVFLSFICRYSTLVNIYPWWQRC